MWILIIIIFLSHTLKHRKRDKAFERRQLHEKSVYTKCTRAEESDEICAWHLMSLVGKVAREEGRKNLLCVRNCISIFICNLMRAHNSVLIKLRIFWLMEIL